MCALKKKLSMKKLYILIYLFTNLLAAQIPAGYYNSATGLSGEDLRNALKTIISTGHIKLPYTSSTSTDVWKSYQHTDVRPGNTTIIWDMYSDRPNSSPAYTFTLYTNQCGTATMESSCYSREHCFPKSWWGGFDDAANPQYTDLHHLFPADQYVNLKKSNYPIGKVGTATWTSTNGSKVGPSAVAGYNGTIFEPIDEYKGDFARAYLYIVTRYKDKISNWIASNSGQQIVNVMEGDSYKSFYLNMLIQWHLQDPVSAKEINRNNAIYYSTPQKNRNPFIDHPEYVDAIWNSATINLAAPVGQNAQAVAAHSFSAQWTTVEGADQGYLLDVSASPTFSNTYPQVATDLFFSEYVEGSSNNKYIEIFNGTGGTISLSNYRLQLYANGATSPTQNITLSGSLASGATVVYQNSSAVLYSGALNNSAINFNGDDAIALYKISTASFVDIVGRIGEQPVPAWKSGEHSTENKTLVRNPTVFRGVSTNPSSGFPTLTTEWDVDDIDDVSNLGTHAFNTTMTVDDYLAGYQNKSVPLQATQSEIVSNLNLNTTYYYRLRAKKGNVLSPYSNTITVTTKNETIWDGAGWSNTTGPTIGINAILNGNYNTTTHGSFSCKELVVAAGRTLIVGNNSFVEGQNTITNNGTFFIENNGSLVQRDNAAAYIGNSLIYKRRTTPLKQYDYTYWSSPLKNQPLQVLSNPSLFYSFTPSINIWSGHADNTMMEAGKGYIARAPSNLNYSSPQTVEAVFNGIPNNGIINVPIVKGAGTFNLIGNPYPSALDIDLFLTHPANQSVVNGTVYLWNHNTAIGAQNQGGSGLNYSSNDYAKYNLTGGVRTTSSGTGSVIPSGTIASGQGFFIEANSAAPAGNYTAVFNNTMRITGENNQFFRAAPLTANVVASVEKNRMWVSISNQEGAFNETLIGYLSGATNSFDSMYDGKMFPAGNPVSIYSIQGENLLSIQGRALPFAVSDTVPLGYNCSLAGNYTIKIENTDGFFASMGEVYLKDADLNLVHNLKDGPYHYSTNAGTFNSRFEILYQNTLGQNSSLYDQNQVVVYNSNDSVLVSAGESLIEQVKVYDLNGRLLLDMNDINATETKISVLGSKVLFLHIILRDGMMYSKKIICP
jgi:endonuclease I